MNLSSFLFGLLFIPFLYRIDFLSVVPNETVILKPQGEVKQSFISKHENLYSMRILSNNPRLEYKGPLFIRLFTENENKKVAEINLYGVNIGTDMWLRIQFPLQSDSYNKKYLLTINMPQIEMDKNPTLEFYKSKTGNLIFKTYYKVSIWQYVSEVASELRGRILADREFFIFYALALLILLTATGYVLRS